MISRGETVVNRGETGWPLQMIFLDVLYGEHPEIVETHATQLIISCLPRYIEGKGQAEF